MILGNHQSFASPEEAFNELHHHGVKGMHWGFRKEDAEISVGKVGPLGRGRKDKYGRNRRFDQANVGYGSTVALILTGPLAFAIPRVREEIKQASAFNRVVQKERKMAKKDFKWEKKVYTTPSAMAVHNAMADHFNARIGAINNKPKYNALDLVKAPESKLAKQYMNEVNALTHEGNRLAVQQVHGKSPSGKKMAQLSEDGQSIKIVDADKVKHAADEEVIEFRLRRDDRGRILEMNTADISEMVQRVAMYADYMEHHGVKGMHWGVRKEDKLVGRESGGLITSGPGDGAKAEEYHRLAGGIVKQVGVDSKLAAAKYGPPAMQGQIKKQHQADHEKLKKIAIGAGLGLGAAAAGVAIYKIDQAGGFDKFPGADSRKVFTLLKTNVRAYNNSVDGLNINWEHGVDLPKGSVIRRLSSVAETAPRPDGFYAAYLDNDVNSYKAILPTFWNGWGVGDAEDGGFLNHYMAKEAIKAPSGKESFELFKHLINTDDTFDAHFANPLFGVTGLRGLSDEKLKKSFVESSAHWANNDNEFTKHWMKEVKSRGYNALIDFNDAGKLGKTPLRLIDGNMFDIVKNEPQTLNDFYQAAKQWSPELIHICRLESGEYAFIHVDDFLSIAELGHDAIARMSDQFSLVKV